MRSQIAIKSHPVHPMLVSFPIGMWVMAFIFDLLAVSQGNGALWAAGFYCIIAGCITAVLAALAGSLDWYSVVPPDSSARKRGLIHGGLNSLVLLVFIYVAYRLGSAAERPDKASLLLMFGAVIVLGISGWMGGTMVYRNQIGVDHRYAGSGRFKSRSLAGWNQPACNKSELADGQMLLANVGRERVVIGRCSDGLFAFSDHCTHSGGPLSDGALVGCTVQCPWHGSQFDVKTGRVVAGPAEEKIKIYELETRGNEVYVKPKVSQEKPKKAA
jgi:nitrite reductase/ring-hydroxylating ferredoxin subunit/uncharacterized membrane protein